MVTSRSDCSSGQRDFGIDLTLIQRRIEYERAKLFVSDIDVGLFGLQPAGNWS